MEQNINKLNYRKLNISRTKSNSHSKEKQKNQISPHLKLKKYNLYLYN